MSLLGVVAALLACVGYGTASVLQSYAARNSVAAGGDVAENGPTLRLTITAMLAPIFIAGMALDLFGFVGSLVSARLIPLFLSQTIISANLVVTAVLSIFVLHVRLHRRDWIAIAKSLWHCASWASPPDASATAIRARSCTGASWSYRRSSWAWARDRSGHSAEAPRYLQA